MGIKDTWQELDKIKHEVNRIDLVDRRGVGRWQGLKSFGRRAARALRLVFAEKELITFAILQWLSIAVGYLLWVQMLGWIPAEVWKSASDLSREYCFPV